MKDFDDIANTTGSFPDVSAVDNAVPGSGTPWVKQIADELFGVFQVLLDAAGLTPNASAESSAGSGSIESSQVVQAIQALFCPAGMVVGIPTDTVPTGARLLKLEGQVILRATYPRLIANVEQSAHTDCAFYRCNAGGAYDAAGAYMLLPDLRGQFLRGRDSAGTVDPDGASRDFGNLQSHALQKHNHLLVGHPLAADLYGFANENVPAASTDRGVAFASTATAGADAKADEVQCGEDIAVDADVTGVGQVDADESRPTNTILTWCITY